MCPYERNEQTACDPSAGHMTYATAATLTRRRASGPIAVGPGAQRLLYHPPGGSAPTSGIKRNYGSPAADRASSMPWVPPSSGTTPWRSPRGPGDPVPCSSRWQELVSRSSPGRRAAGPVLAERSDHPWAWASASLCTHPYHTPPSSAPHVLGRAPTPGHPTCRQQFHLWPLVLPHEVPLEVVLLPSRPRARRCSRPEPHVRTLKGEVGWLAGWHRKTICLISAQTDPPRSGGVPGPVTRTPPLSEQFSVAQSRFLKGKLDVHVASRVPFQERAPDDLQQHDARALFGRGGLQELFQGQARHPNRQLIDPCFEE